MAKRKKDTMEFRFYELPQGESALVLCGESWKRVYGHEEFHLHFHNLLEIGICREGDGNMYLDEDIYQYHDGDITFIPENFPHVTVSYGEVVNFWEYIFIDIHSVIEEMFPNNAAFQNEAVTTISKKAFMTNVYQSPAMAEYINAIIRETSEHKIYCQRTIKLLVQGIVIELLRMYDELPEEDNNIVKGTNMSQIATALDYMNKHYSESIKAGELSALCNMSETHFRRLFESYINMPPMLYKLCDIYGIYMIAENNLESHGTWEAYNKGYVDLDFVVPKDKPQWREMMLDRANSCYQRDKNHPAILIWSCGNESFGGKTIYEMSQLFRQLDKHRLVHYEGVFNDRSYNDTSDMESQMYTPAAGIEKFLAEHPEKPFICCEYTHAMGNSCGAMHKYTELTDREPRYQGGFIWDYIDQSIYKKDRYGKWFLTYGGDFGDRPTDGDFSGNGICYGGEREASPKMQEVKFNYQNISVDFDSDYIFTVTNKNLFVNTSVFDAFAILLADGEEVYRTKLQISVPPMDRVSYEVPVTLKNSMIDVEKEYCIVVSFVLKENTIWEKAGYEIAFGQHMIKKPVSEYSCDKSVELVVGNGNILVRGENFKALFSRMNLGMVSYVYGGVEMLPNTIPLPNFWRTPTNNDSGNMMPQRYAQWKIASMYVTTRQDQRFADTSPRVEKNNNNIAITYTYFMPTTPQSSCEVTYRVFGDGTIETTLSYDPVKELGDMPEFGMMFKLDADYDTVKWYGLGPQETYEDRQHGGKYGVYENKVADNVAEYLVPQESGNKCRVRYAKVMDKKGRGMLFFGDELSFSALPYTPHELENAAHHFELPPVHYTVVRVAKKQMGVGGDDSWGAHTHPEYLLDVSEKMEFTFCFRGI